MDIPSILALDPGGTTGWCWYKQGPPEQLQRGQISEAEHHLRLEKLLEEVATATGRNRLVIVCERFEFRQDDRDRDKIDYIAGEYVGVVKRFWQQHQRQGVIDLVMQSAAQVKGRGKHRTSKTFWGDDSRLRKLGLWIPGQPHAMDATRHYLYYRTFTLGDASILHQLR
jgi:hypothetical protein